jgi:hypothetical protein
MTSRHLSGLCGDLIGELAYAFELGGFKSRSIEVG